MHAVAVTVALSVDESEAGVKELREIVVPRISQAPGFSAGYWTRSADKTNGQSLVIFDSEEHATAAAEMVGQMPPPSGVSIQSVEVREVVANA